MTVLSAAPEPHERGLELFFRGRRRLFRAVRLQPTIDGGAPLSER